MKMRMKFTLLASVSMTLPLLAGCAQSTLTDSSEPASTDGLIYQNNPYMATCALLQYTGSETNLVLPATHNGRRLVCIWSDAFAGNKTLASISIPASVDFINMRAFQGCSALKTVTFAKDASLSFVGDSAFAGCDLSGGFDLPSTVTSLGSSAFDSSSLKAITLPSGLSSLGDSAFNGCASLTSVTFAKNSGISEIKKNEFAGCASLKEFNLPNSVHSIGPSAFSGCSSLAEITLSSSVQTIGDSAFAGCSSLATLALPSSVNSIGDLAFTGCSSLASIEVDKNNGSYSTDGRALMDKEGDKILAYANGSGASYDVPSSVSTLGSYAFFNCTSLTTLNLPSSLKTIGDGILVGCTSLSAISLGAGNTFFSCDGTALTDAAGTTLLAYAEGAGASYTVKDGITSIFSYAFAGDSLLTEITLSASVKHLYAYAFANCTALTSLSFAGTKAVFDKVTLDASWNEGTSQIKLVHCSDGDYTLKS